MFLFLLFFLIVTTNSLNCKTSKCYNLKTFEDQYWEDKFEIMDESNDVIYLFIKEKTNTADLHKETLSKCNQVLDKKNERWEYLKKELSDIKNHPIIFSTGALIGVLITTIVSKNLK